MATGKGITERVKGLSPHREHGILQKPSGTPETSQVRAITSLLWPSDTERSVVQLSPTVAADLALDRIIQALNASGRHERIIRNTLCELCTDPAVIRYRQDVLADLLRIPPLTAALRALLPDLAGLAKSSGGGWVGDSPLLAITGRLEELDHFVTCVDRLRALLDGAVEIRSEGLRNLREDIRTLAEDHDVVALRAQLPELHELIAETTSVTIGVNLGPDLKPESVTIVDLNRFQFKGARSLIGRLLPVSTTSGHPGMSPLQQVGPVSLRKDSKLFRDLEGLLEAAVAPLAKALTKYEQIKVTPLAALEGELAFFTGAAAFVTRLQAAGMSVCRPEIAPAEERAFSVCDGANAALALQMLGSRDNGALRSKLVTSDIVFEAGTRLLILTGPNRGGKTTFCRALGQAQVLLQAGLYMPGTSARISPVDGIWTHFPLPETDRPGAGRLDEEVQRLRRIFDEATPNSLILMNEPLTSTSERGALSIARDLVRGLQVLGARVLLVTHLHDLAMAIPELNATGPEGSGVQSLVAGATEADGTVRSTFRIVRGIPLGRSYASEIARQHGLTFEQLERRLAERSRPPAEPSA